MTYAMNFLLYNTLTRKKEIFKPLIEDVVKIYSCGPTVYSDPHVGNLRAFTNRWLLGDVFRYVLEYQTIHVMNITDVGHLTDDGDEWEDKMEKWSKREGLSAREIAEKYTMNFKTYIHDMYIQFDALPRATNYIKEQIDILRDLQEKWYTYTIPWDGIYMDTGIISDYGKLMWPNYKQALAGLEVWIRVEASGKKNNTDFALWKFSPLDEQRQMEWILDWPREGSLIDDENKDTLSAQEKETKGFPWWHLECSAMSRALLGDNFDIHTWWVEHVPVHHSNEIAQSECSFCHKKPRVTYWLHGQFLNINGAKISKSAGDDLSLPWLQKKWYTPLDLRYFFFTGQYRNFLDFTRESLDAAKMTRQNMIKKIYTYAGDRIIHFRDVDKCSIDNSLFLDLTSPLLDDLDTPKFLANLQKTLSNLNDDVLNTILYIDTYILKIGLYEGVITFMEKHENTIPQWVKELAMSRREAKQNKDYLKADELRKQIQGLWWSVKDADGMWEVEPLEM